MHALCRDPRPQEPMNLTRQHYQQNTLQAPEAAADVDQVDIVRAIAEGPRLEHLLDPPLGHETLRPRRLTSEQCQTNKQSYSSMLRKLTTSAHQRTPHTDTHARQPSTPQKIALGERRHTPRIPLWAGAEHRQGSLVQRLHAVVIHRGRRHRDTGTPMLILTQGKIQPGAVSCTSQQMHPPHCAHSRRRVQNATQREATHCCNEHCARTTQ